MIKSLTRHLFKKNLDAIRFILRSLIIVCIIMRMYISARIEHTATFSMRECN